MLKILIVDDELLVRLALKSAIDWEKHGLDLIGEAGDGIEALDIIDKVIPDIVLVDIFMPNMNGLELIKTASRKYPYIKFLILSCHNEYEYVREGMKLGAFDYILKLSMQPQDLIDALKSIAKQIESERKKSENINKINEQFDLNKKIIRKNFFNDILNGNILSEDEFKNTIEYLNLNLNSTYFAVAVFQIDRYSKESSCINRDKSSDQSAVNIIHEVVSGYGFGEVFRTNPEEYVLLVGFESEDRWRAISDSMSTVANESIELLKTVLSKCFSCGISSYGKGYKGIGVGYEQAVESIEYKFYKGMMSITFFDELCWTEDNDVQKKECFKELISAIDGLDFPVIRQNIKVMFHAFDKDRNILPRFVRKLVKELLFNLNKSGESYECNIDSIEGIKDIFSILDSIEFLDELENFSMDITKRFNELIDRERGKGCRQEINKVKDYVNANFNEKITVARMSRFVNMNSDYFSHLFKKEVGISFVEYLTSIRMEKAKEYLKRGDMKVYEVADKVGYSNFNYFSKLFKREVGIRPLKYLRSIKS